MFINSAEWKEGLPKKVRPSYSYRKEGSFSPRCQYRGEGHTVIGATPGLLILCAVRLETQNLLPSWEQKFHASRHNTQAAPKIISNLLRPPRGDGDYEAIQKTGHPNDDSIGYRRAEPGLWLRPHPDTRRPGIRNSSSTTHNLTYSLSHAGDI